MLSLNHSEIIGRHSVIHRAWDWMSRMYFRLPGNGLNKPPLLSEVQLSSLNMGMGTNRSAIVTVGQDPGGRW